MKAWKKLPVVGQVIYWSGAIRLSKLNKDELLCSSILPDITFRLWHPISWVFVVGTFIVGGIQAVREDF